MERPDNRNDNQHIIEIASVSGPILSSTSIERLPTGLENQQGENQPSSRSRIPPLFSVGSSSRNPSVTRGNNQDRLRRPWRSKLWISFEFVYTISQIIAAIVVLCFSKNEKPQTPLRVWIVGYTSGCFVLVPFLCWRFIQRNRGSADVSQRRNIFGRLNRRSVEGEDGQTTTTAAGGAQNNGLPTNRRVWGFEEYFRMALDCYFAVWFVLGNVWVFGGHSSSAGSPTLYKLCVVFLAFNCIGYAMPFLLCCGMCCCLPCLISYSGIREEFSQDRGATQDSINSLPTYKFKVKKGKSRRDKGNTSGAGGVVAAGTEKERYISEDDAVCSICLANYVNNEELKELPCSHIFHRECVDKWLKINSSCPLCKAEIGYTVLSYPPDTTANP